MHYVCIENNIVTSILNYEPSVPESVSVVIISDNDLKKIENQTHFFNVETQTVEPVADEIVAQKTQEKLNAVHREFLNSSDWKILRHMRQKALNTETTLTDAEYLALEQQRSDAAAQIINE
jgi:nitrogenase subunit NifH